MDIENRLAVAKGKRGCRRDGPGVWDQQMQTLIYRMDKQQGCTVTQGTAFNIP